MKHRRERERPAEPRRRRQRRALTVSSRSQHRCARTHLASPAASVRAHRGVSCILECPVPRNVLLDPSVDPIALTVTSAWPYVSRAGRLACAPAPRVPAARLVFCVLTCCVLYLSNPSRPTLCSLAVVVCRAALAPRGHRRARPHLHSKRHGNPYCASRMCPPATSTLARGRPRRPGEALLDRSARALRTIGHIARVVFLHSDAMRHVS